MSDIRVYKTGETYTCSSCGRALIWEKRKDCNALILVHELPYTGCINAGKKFYAPGHDLTEFKEADLG